jgi:hypothetical protein
LGGALHFCWIPQTTFLIAGYTFTGSLNCHYLNITAMKTYDTLVDATNDLLKRGYTANLILDGDTIDDNDKGVKMAADDIEIDEFYRFEGASNPDDMSIVYAVSSEKYNLKGVLVNAYGTYADNSSSAIAAKLHHNQVSHNLHGEDRPAE